MPFYEYQCQRCGHHLEAMQKVSDRPLRKCPKCGKPALTRLMSAPVFRLRGGGWYETDFKSDGEGKRNLADKPDAAAPKDDKKEAAATTDAGAKSGAAKDGAAKEAPGKEAPGKEAAPKDSPGKNEKKPASTTSPVSRKRRRNQIKPVSRRR
jgi:putative FmdB family regulatory protein